MKRARTVSHRPRSTVATLRVFKDRNPKSKMFRLIIDGHIVAVQADGSRVNGHATLATVLARLLH